LERIRFARTSAHYHLINGVQATDYRERPTRNSASRQGRHQVHGGGKTLVQVKEIAIEAGFASRRRFVPASAPGKMRRHRRFHPTERASFTLSQD
jgi:hypothetical protein